MSHIEMQVGFRHLIGAKGGIPPYTRLYIRECSPVGGAVGIKNPSFNLTVVNRI